jgi:uncharacterized protein (TIGR02246 family)
VPEQPTVAPSEVPPAWITAFNARDLYGISSLYADDAVLWGTFSSNLVTTAKGVREYFERAFAPLMQASAELQGFHLQSLGSLVVASGSYMLTANIAGQRRVLPARFTFVLSGGSGSWVIVNHHSSLTPT